MNEHEPECDCGDLPELISVEILAESEAPEDCDHCRVHNPPIVVDPCGY